MPVVFTGAVFSIPAFLFSMAGIGDHPASGFFNTSLWFRPENMFYTLGAILYALCIFFFTFLYNNMASNPIEIAEMIEKRGGTVEGRHPGAETAAYIKKETSRMLAAGGFFILAISLLPMGLSGVTGVNGIAFLGTSVLIITGTIVETYKELFAAAQPAREQKKLEKGGLL